MVRADIINAAMDLRAGDTPIVTGDLPGNLAGNTSNNVITVDPAKINGSTSDLSDVLAHEGSHDAFHDSVKAGETPFNQKGIQRVNTDEAQHEVMRKGGVIQCADEMPCGNTKCTFDNAQLERTKDCLAGVGGVDQPLCRGFIDIPCVRVVPPLSGCFLIEDRPNPLCRTVLCGSEYSAGVSPSIPLPVMSQAIAARLLRETAVAPCRVPAAATSAVPARGVASAATTASAPRGPSSIPRCRRSTAWAARSPRDPAAADRTKGKNRPFPAHSIGWGTGLTGSRRGRSLAARTGRPAASAAYEAR